ncbi:MAG: prolyl oligopeptidase family serine peptidase [Myxococcales bacterium]|jgi:poly(3-hydroxybutyrate) depolymerase|nr:prolyl oligopeptidase family serine peptidase [Myxococcales bacterium]MBL0196056.1 prolyl oligopeptidase family serine peptidase [Myxococcales bacterium]
MRLRFVALAAAFVPFLLRCSSTDAPGGATTADGAVPTASTPPTGSTPPTATVTPEGGPADAGRDTGASDASSEEDAEPPPPPLPTTSPGCGLAASPSPAAGVRKTVTVGGVARSFVLFVPAGYDPTRAYPVVLVFHGIGATGAQMAQFIAMQTYAAGEAIVAFPDGRGGAWDLGGTTDLDFFDALTADLENTLCVNPQRAFAVGFSYGAYMTNYLACNRPRTVRAIVAAAGSFAGTGCGSTAALVYHRADDNDEPVANGRNARDAWLSYNGCASTSTPSPAPMDGLGCVTYDGCAAGTPVVWCEDRGASAYKHDFRDVYRVPAWNWLNQF